MRSVSRQYVTLHVMDRKLCFRQSLLLSTLTQRGSAGVGRVSMFSDSVGGAPVSK